MGNWYGELLAGSSEFNIIETVIPVSLHPKKLKSRGFNQVEGFGKAIAKNSKLSVKTRF